MLIDEKGKLFGKISVVDILIIVVIFLGAIFLYQKFSDKDVSLISKEQTGKVRMTCVGLMIPNELTTIIKKGDAVKDYTNNNYYGTVVDVKYGDSPYYAYNSEGKMILSPKPGYKLVTVTIEGNGRYVGPKAYFNNVEYYPNEEFGLVAGRIAVWVYVAGLEKM